MHGFIKIVRQASSESKPTSPACPKRRKARFQKPDAFLEERASFGNEHNSRYEWYLGWLYRLGVIGLISTSLTALFIVYLTFVVKTTGVCTPETLDNGSSMKWNIQFTAYLGCAFLAQVRGCCCCALAPKMLIWKALDFQWNRYCKVCPRQQGHIFSSDLNW